MRIAIIGTGLMGLAAAWSLGPGHDVVLVEPASQLGGSERSLVGPQRLGLPPLDPPDLAGSARSHPRLLALHRLLDLPLRWEDGGLGLFDRDHDRLLSLAAPSSVQRLVQALTGTGHAREAVIAALRDLRLPADPGASVAWHLLRRSPSPGDLRQWVWPWLGALLGQPAVDLHAVPAGLGPWVAIPDPEAGPLLCTAHGHSALLEALMVDSPPRELRLGAVLLGLRETDKGAELLLAGAPPQLFDAVLLALPPDQLAALPADALPSAGWSRPPPELARGSSLVLHTDPRFVPRGSPSSEGRWLAWSEDRVTITQRLPDPLGGTLFLSRILGEAPELDGVLARQRRTWPAAWSLGENTGPRRRSSSITVVQSRPGPYLEAALRAGMHAARTLWPDARRTRALDEIAAVA